MKKLLILLFSLLISFNSAADNLSPSSIIGIDRDGNYYINSIIEIGFNPDHHEPVSLNFIVNHVLARKEVYPDMKILIAADKNASFESVFIVIKLLKEYGLEGINLIDYSEYLGNYSKRYLGVINFEHVVEDPITLLQNAWVRNITAKVKNMWHYSGHEKGWSCKVDVFQDRQGVVKGVSVMQCNTDDSDKARSFKDSIERAVYKASPLPSAPDESVFDEVIYFTFVAN